MASVPDHDMVVQFNLKGIGGCFQSRVVWMSSRDGLGSPEG